MTSWDTVAHEKLVRVLGAEAADEARRTVLQKLGLTELKSAEDLYRFAQSLVALGGFAGAVGGLLAVHATIHGANSGTP